MKLIKIKKLLLLLTIITANEHRLGCLAYFGVGSKTEHLQKALLSLAVLTAKFLNLNDVLMSTSRKIPLNTETKILVTVGSLPYN